MDVMVRMKVIFLIISMVTSLGLKVESTKIDGFNEQLYTVKATVSDSLEFIQHLSYNQIFGFETVDEMSKKDHFQDDYYDVGVNGAFYNDVGIPSGKLIIDGELILNRSYSTPMFLVNQDGKPSIEMVEMNVSVIYQENEYEVFEVNGKLHMNELNIYTSWYGTTNRVYDQHVAIFVRDGVIDNIIEGITPTKIGEAKSIREDSYVLCYKGDNSDNLWKIGEEIQVIVDSNINIRDVKQGFQTGGYLVKAGENVSKDAMSYVNWSDSLQPRTVIGLTEDGQIIIKVVDGRNPGISEGLTGDQMAELMIDDGCVVAANLDGGASSTMVINGEVINTPSYQGESKGVAHSFHLDRRWENMLLY